jgi:hypothetical protein
MVSDIFNKDRIHRNARDKAATKLELDPNMILRLPRSREELMEGLGIYFTEKAIKAKQKTFGHLSGKEESQPPEDSLDMPPAKRQKQEHNPSASPAMSDQSRAGPLGDRSFHSRSLNEAKGQYTR